MKRSKNRAERFFHVLISTVIRFRIPTLIATLLIAAALGSNIRHLRFDTSNEGFLHPNDPILFIYNEFRDQFGRDDMIALAVQSDEIFSFDFLNRLKALHEDLNDSVVHLNDITSMVNARNTEGRGDVLLVDDLLAHFPESEEELAELKRKVMANPLYINQMISENGLFTSLVIESVVYSGSSGENDLLAGFSEEGPVSVDNGSASGVYLSDEENSAFVESVAAVVTRHNTDKFRIHMAGAPVVMHTIKHFMKKDVQTFMRFVILIIGLCLFLVFRRISGVLLPLLVVALSVASTVGLMSLLGVSFKLPTTILPSFLLAVGVGASVHAISLTYQNLHLGDPRNEAIVEAFTHSGLAIVMTSLTTAAGLASFSFASVAPIADLGLFSAVGVLISLFFTMTLLPALLSLLPLKQHARFELGAAGKMEIVLDRLADFSVRRSTLVLITGAALIICGVIGITRVQFSHNVLKWLPEELGVRQATELIDREMKGSVVLEVVLDTGRENGLYDRRLLLDLDRVVAELEEQHRNNAVFIGKTISVTTILKEIHQALHANDPNYYAIADNEKLIPQEFLLFENSGSDDLEGLVDSRFQLARITFKVPWQDALLYVPFIRDIKDRFEHEFGGRKLKNGEVMKVTVTGIMSLFGRIIYAAMYSAAQSYGIALVVITLLMIILIGNFRLGLISMVPNLGPILIVLGFMGWMGIQLDMFTMLIASIAIGLAVDDTIHFMYNFRRYYEESGNLEEAIHHTLHTSGRAMLTTSIVLSIGFFIFMFASMNNLYYFGLLTGIAIIIALAADLILAPALMAKMVSSGSTLIKFKNSDPGE